ncbi:MAG: cell division protein ZapA [Bacteroidota bacterium]|nr:cell division protein ZapA [Bacteroidota bacterium]
MRELSIKIVIAGRTYPLTVKENEEENVRKAAKLIEDKIKDFEQNYSVRDRQDLLAMSALQFANEAVSANSKNFNDSEGLVEQVEVLDTLIENYLKNV